MMKGMRKRKWHSRVFTLLVAFTLVISATGSVSFGAADTDDYAEIVFDKKWS